jgi:glutamine---fructose-6-phosphate transaminase (isomerizing)
VLALCNVVGSSIAREADGGVYLHAGPEVGVASTKAFTNQVAVLAMLALYFGRLRLLSSLQGARMIRELRSIPDAVRRALSCHDRVRDIAERYSHVNNFLYLGRQYHYPVALEGALKLKEISYVSTDAYAAGEMKHGPIALLDEATPVVCVATRSPVLEKLLSNVQEARARGAHVIAVTTSGDQLVEPHVDATIAVPASDWMLQPILAVIPLQLLAYAIARNRGLNVDQPRNLAKTVTVE